MNMLKTLSLAAVLGAALGSAAPAQAAIIDVSATSLAEVSVMLDPGAYTIEWIGVADGGAYDAWNADCAGGACDSGWTNAVTFSAGPGPNPEFYRTYLPGPGFASAAQSLAAFQAGPITLESYFFSGGNYLLDGTFVVPPPLQISAGLPVEVRFYIEDATPQDNFGGVSLRLTNLAAVPEPGAWALMIAGFGLAGAALRRRRAAVA